MTLTRPEKEIRHCLKYAERKLQKPLKETTLVDWDAAGPVEAWEIEAAKLPGNTIIPELEGASDAQVMRLSVMSSVHQLLAVIAELKDLIRKAPGCCRTHDGPHVHGCILPGDHRGQCQLPTEQER